MRSTTAPGQPYLEAIQGTYDDLRRWKDRVAVIEEPQRGSDLFVDDKVFPRHPISQVARMSLGMAGEHLRLARDAIEAGQLYPSAHFTVLRSALVGAAQGVWVLAPQDRAARRENGLTVLSEMHKQMTKHYRRLAGFDLTQAQRDDLAEQQTWLAARRAAVAAVRTSAAELNLTVDVIPAALDYVFADTERRQDGRALWALTSADAHVLGWSTASRGSFGRTDRATGLAEGTAGGSFADIAQPFIASHKLLRAGWSLFDRRCEGP